MAILLSDLLSRRMDIMGKIAQQPLTATGTFPIFTTPAGFYGAPGGMLRTFVCAVVLDNPTGASGNVTCSFGSGATATDFVGSGAIAEPTATAATAIFFAPATGIFYSGGQVFNFKITVAGLGACDLTVLGWTE